MSSIFLTIFTPTYNRVELLPRLYQSIVDNNINGIEWLIVDDGSTDNTKQVVQGWIDEKIIPIRYIYQENSGKYIAHNTGVLNAYGELFCCIDSDDLLAPNATILLKNTWSKIKKEINVVGIVAYKNNFQDICIGSPLPNQEFVNYLDLRFIHKIHGDHLMAFRTEALKNNLFPVLPGTKFITEAYLYSNVGHPGTYMYILPKCLNVCEYRTDGYSRNMRNIRLSNPLGFKIFYRQEIDLSRDFLHRMINIMNYHIYSWISKDKEYSYSGKYKLLVLLGKIPGLLWYIRFTRNNKE